MAIRQVFLVIAGLDPAIPGAPEDGRVRPGHDDLYRD